MAVPAGGFVRIDFPPEIQYPFGSTQSPFCSVSQGGNTNFPPAWITPQITVLIKLSSANTVTSWFTTSLVAMQITCSGFVNPRTTNLISPFKVTTYDNTNKTLEVASTTNLLQMSNLPVMNNFQVLVTAVPPNSQNPTNITLNYTTAVMFKNGDQFSITFPPQVTLTPYSACPSVNNTLVCNVQGNTIIG